MSLIVPEASGDNTFLILFIYRGPENGEGEKRRIQKLQHPRPEVWIIYTNHFLGGNGPLHPPSVPLVIE